MKFIDGVIRVKCLMQAYYRDETRAKDSVILFYEEDIDKGIIKAGPDKGKPKPEMPRWAKVVPHDTPLTLRDGEDAEDVTTLSQMSSKGTPAQQKAAQKVKEDRKTLDAERVQFEKDKAAFEASKDAPEDIFVTGGPLKDAGKDQEQPKKWRGATKRSKKK